MKTITLRLKGSDSFSYDICIGYEIRERLGAILAARAIAQRYVVLADSNAASLYGPSLLRNLQGAHLRQAKPQRVLTPPLPSSGSSCKPEQTERRRLSPWEAA
jgi:hypothetical protein